MRDFGKCESVISHRKIVLQERRSRIVFGNESRRSVRVVEIDGCVITQGPRCDYLVIPYSQVEHYVELKGGDFSHAVRQLERTIREVSEAPKAGEKCCFVVSTRCPRLTPRIQALSVRFKRQYNSVLIITRSGYKHPI